MSDLDCAETADYLKNATEEILGVEAVVESELCGPHDSDDIITFDITLSTMNESLSEDLMIQVEDDHFEDSLSSDVPFTVSGVSESTPLYFGTLITFISVAKKSN